MMITCFQIHIQVFVDFQAWKLDSWRCRQWKEGQLCFSHHITDWLKRKIVFFIPAFCWKIYRSPIPSRSMGIVRPWYLFCVFKSFFFSAWCGMNDKREQSKAFSIAYIVVLFVLTITKCVIVRTPLAQVLHLPVNVSLHNIYGLITENSYPVVLSPFIRFNYCNDHSRAQRWNQCAALLFFLCTPIYTHTEHSSM